MIKLIASDLDGTILDSKHSIPDDNLKAKKYVNILTQIMEFLEMEVKL